MPIKHFLDESVHLRASVKVCKGVNACKRAGTRACTCVRPCVHDCALRFSHRSRWMCTLAEPEEFYGEVCRDASCLVVGCSAQAPLATAGESSAEGALQTSTGGKPRYDCFVWGSWRHARNFLNAPLTHFRRLKAAESGLYHQGDGWQPQLTFGTGLNHTAFFQMLFGQSCSGKRCSCEDVLDA